MGEWDSSLHPDLQAQQATGSASGGPARDPESDAGGSAPLTANTRLKFNPMRQIRFDLSSVAPQATPGHIAQAPSRNSESLVCHPIVNACGAADATQVGPALTASPQAQVLYCLYSSTRTAAHIPARRMRTPAGQAHRPRVTTRNIF